MALEWLRLEDLSDREVLLVVDDVADADGWAWAYDVGERLGVVESHRRRAPAQRLSWLARYGAVEREILQDDAGNYRYVGGDPERPKYGQRWRLTDLGVAIADGRLKAAAQRTVDNVGDGELVMLTQAVAEAAKRRHSDQIRKLTDRAHRHTWLRSNGGPP